MKKLKCSLFLPSPTRFSRINEEKERKIGPFGFVIKLINYLDKKKLEIKNVNVVYFEHKLSTLRFLLYIKIKHFTKV